MRKFFLTTACCFLVLNPTVTWAQGVPTVDEQNILQNIRQLQNMLQDLGVQNEQLDQLLLQVDQLEAQLTKLEELYASLTGKRDILGLVMDGNLNSLLDESLTEVIGTIQRGMMGDWSGLASSKSVNMHKSMDEVLSAAGFEEGAVEALAGSNVPGARRAASQATSGALISAVGEQAHVESGESLQRVDRLVGMIPEMPDLKASIDLNTRVTAELAISLAKLVELESVTAVNSGMGGVLDAAAVAEERAFMTFGAP